MLISRNLHPHREGRKPKSLPGSSGKGRNGKGDGAGRLLPKAPTVADFVTEALATSTTTKSVWDDDDVSNKPAQNPAALVGNQYAPLFIAYDETANVPDKKKKSLEGETSPKGESKKDDSPSKNGKGSVSSSGKGKGSTSSGKGKGSSSSTDGSRSSGKGKGGKGKGGKGAGKGKGAGGKGKGFGVIRDDAKVDGSTLDKDRVANKTEATATTAAATAAVIVVTSAASGPSHNANRVQDSLGTTPASSDVEFGYNVAVDGTRKAIGSSKHDWLVADNSGGANNNGGAVAIYDYDGNTWVKNANKQLGRWPIDLKGDGGLLAILRGGAQPRPAKVYALDDVTFRLKAPSFARQQDYVTYPRSTTVHDLKLSLEEKFGWPSSEITLTVSANLLEDDKTLQQYAVKTDDVCHVSLRVRGGVARCMLQQSNIA